MPQFQVHTKGDARADGKPKVYFTCHPNDMVPWLDKIVADLHKANDCAVYSCVDMESYFIDEDWDIDLGRMQLFVVPVTFRLLTEPNRAMDSDIPFAIGKSIPILPIMVEEGIDDFYSSRFNELQYLSPAGDGRGGGIEYENKLKRYLESVLIGEEEGARIRAAFDAYVFLSYRKADRRLADKLMKTVHGDPRCCGIALWYDEFLVPGESFRENINRALSDSKLFALLVTPNILECRNGKPNFVMGVEYPAARAANMEIAAIEAEKTDHGSLASSFDGLSSTYPLWDEPAKERLLNSIARFATEADSNDQLHNYLLGLAYLKGIDVEVDSFRGVNLITQAAEAGLPEAMSRITEMYRHGDGVQLNYAEAIMWAERLYKHLKTDYGETHPYTLSALSDLAAYYDDLGKYSKAAEIGEKAYRLLNETLGESHPDTLTSLNNLANYYAHHGDNVEATNLGEKVCRLRRVALGESHPDTLATLNNLAIYYCSLGNYHAAVALEEEAYRARREMLGECHSETLDSMSNIAGCWWKLGDYNKATELEERAYKLRRETLGEIHPDALASLSNLATYYADLGNHTKAAELGEEAHHLLSTVLGKSHPNTLTSLSVLAKSYWSLGDYRKAVELGKRAHRLRRETLGKIHPDTLTSLSNLATYYADLGNHTKAAELGEEAYRLRRETLGGSHPDTIASLNILASCYSNIGYHSKAAELGEEAYRLRRETLGETHPDTLATLSNLATYYSDLGDYRRAAELGEEAHRLFSETFGATHPYSALSLANLANYINNLGDNTRAMKLEEQAYRQICDALGEAHPYAISVLSNLTLFRQLIDEPQDA